MDRAVKLILALALMFLAVIIGIGIGNKQTKKGIESLTPKVPQVPQTLTAEKSKSATKTAQEKSPAIRDIKKVHIPLHIPKANSPFIRSSKVKCPLTSIPPSSIPTYPNNGDGSV
jgi:hypothetical protein